MNIGKKLYRTKNAVTSDNRVFIIIRVIGSGSMLWHTCELRLRRLEQPREGRRHDGRGISTLGESGHDHDNTLPSDKFMRPLFLFNDLSKNPFVSASYPMFLVHHKQTGQMFKILMCIV